MASDSDMDFGFRYPFSSTAGRIVSSLNITSISSQHLELAKSMVENALSTQKLGFIDVRTMALDYMVSYVYAKMLVSALNSNYFVSRFADAMAWRAKEAMGSDSDKNIARLASEMGMNPIISGNLLALPFGEFLKATERRGVQKLVNVPLGKGMVYLDRYRAISVMEEAVASYIAHSLPIPVSDLPKEVVTYSKGIKLPQPKIAALREKGSGEFAWVEKLLTTPIPDVRHRVVNLILAPYLVNVKGLSEEQAFEIIRDYIEKCKMINPNTAITDSYIMYQCRYAKRRGLKPYTLAHAKELLGSLVEL
ncbi:MAG: DNA primase noncatalytic subunit PriX [Candidatus Micrarchaeia archaeon]